MIAGAGRGRRRGGQARRRILGIVSLEFSDCCGRSVRKRRRAGSDGRSARDLQMKRQKRQGCSAKEHSF
jgi:hypothetical protein